MEHNEYSIHELKIKFNETTRHQDSNGDRLPDTHSLKEETFVFVAPARGYFATHWGEELLKLHLDETYRFAEPIREGVRYEILERRERPIKAILRVSTTYRSQL